MSDPAKWPKIYRYGGQDYEIKDPAALEDAQRRVDGGLVEVEESVDAGPVDSPRVPSPADQQPDPDVERNKGPRKSAWRLDVGPAVIEPEFADDAGSEGYEPPPAPPTPRPKPEPTGKYGPAPATQAGRDPATTGMMENALDALMGFSSGATMMGGDNLIGVLEDMGLYPEGTQALMQEEMALARERSPWLFHGAEAVGGAPMALATGGLGRLAGLGTNLAIGGVTGALGSDDAKDWTGRAEGAGEGALITGVLHGLGEGIGLVGDTARWVRPRLQAISNEARNAVLGSPEDYKRLAQKRGLDFAFEGPAEAARKLGFTNRWKPQSPYDYAKKAEQYTAELGPEISANLEAASLNPETHVMRDMPRRMGANIVDPIPRDVAFVPAAEEPSSVFIRDPVMSLEREPTAPLPAYEDLTAGGPPRLDWAEQEPTAMLDQEPTGILIGGPGGGVPYRPEAAAPLDEYQSLGPQPELLTDPLLRYPERATDRPSVQGALTQLHQSAGNATQTGAGLRSAYGRLDKLLAERPPVLTPAELNDLKSSYYDQAYQAGRAGDMPSSYMEQAASGAGRATNDLLKESLGRHPDPSYLETYVDQAQRYGDAKLIEEMATMKAAGTQGQAASGGVLASASAPATATARRWGPDLAANLTQVGADMAETTGNALSPRLGRLSRDAASLVKPAAVSYAARNAPPWAVPDDVFEERSEGGRLDQRVLGILASNPDALGPFADKLQELANSPDPEALNTELLRLVQTNPAFRQHVLPQLGT